ncbi:precorrin-6A synthase (deacetylating) [Methylobacterium brachiatum]|uniref:Precorrin-6A synthase [deacetylating] n=1 Tax=Methylobacterium brachiatum TaxID=269660 RepID=A0AAJ1TRG6_9HYPH|nr:precorrin-6A synthase (deacetylating) [Methylobacterium brachiatum]MCB4804456.1 precorrin-6A synthase (deacetylating) [Methylobacterium brachiatum]MDH2312461.1 precorrin-6A synthase (deacetylating) [Methylobacterium brachiatum]MDQ0545486.1 precorrin-6A synthase [Methylobacterium brachiatum]
MQDRQIRVIGIGTGDPEHLTLQAVRALSDVDAVFVLDKRAETADLVEIRKRICAAHIRNPHRVVTVDDPPRERHPADYGATVEAWHAARAERLETAFAAELEAGQVGAILVWGDPALYDSTLRILDRIASRGRLALSYAVIPGLSSVQVLAARHGVPLNAIGGPVLITTGRRLAAGWPEGADSVVVMLDGDPRFAHLDPDLTIYWGAYLGSPDEILLAGRLGTVGDEIRRVRAEARARHGWIMDIYLLRRL